MKRVLIAGIGNVLLGDDGVGPYVVRGLAASFEFEPGVQVEDLGTPALDLIDHLTGIDALILVDSVENGAPAGTIEIYLKRRHLAMRRSGAHGPSFASSHRVVVGSGLRWIGTERSLVDWCLRLAV